MMEIPTQQEIFVEGLVVVDTEDALLVADRSRSQEVKQFPEKFKREGRTKLS